MGKDSKKAAQSSNHNACVAVPKRKVNDDEAAAALDKESTDLLGASAVAANAPVVAKQA